MDGLDPDAKLMLRLQSGDLSGFEELVDRHRESVLNLAYRFIGDRVEAEDALQEVFMRVFRARNRYEPTARFSTWLYRIATNYCLNAVKARRAERRWSLHALGANGDVFAQQIAAPDQPAPDEDFARRETAAAIRDAVDRLPDSQRMAILLNKYHGQSYQEIAATMELSVMAVKSLLMRARVNLRERLLRYLKDELPGGAEIAPGAAERAREERPKRCRTRSKDSTRETGS
ncbi:MAG: sigma-70 family RNA polymerase sigma factor [Planctomycetes bacterium]|nr:sigma-70 family RNA polymerase sigma factor [Planctomycetota bacterium]